MKTLLLISALILALAFTGRAFIGPAFAADPWKKAKTEGDCIMANGTWDDKTKTCKKR
jgi:hypothetical protein